MDGVVHPSPIDTERIGALIGVSGMSNSRIDPTSSPTVTSTGTRLSSPYTAFPSR